MAALSVLAPMPGVRSIASSFAWTVGLPAGCNALSESDLLAHKLYSWWARTITCENICASILGLPALVRGRDRN